MRIAGKTRDEAVVGGHVGADRCSCGVVGSIPSYAADVASVFHDAMVDAMTRKNPAAVALGKLGGRKGGKSKSEAKAAAARANGAKGGRPKKPKL